jgi:hypothetical protein
MKKLFAILLSAAAVTALMTNEASAAMNAKKQDVEVAIEARAGNLYDYILIGMNRAATDGLDNAYDTVTPGQGVGEQYVLMVVPHPDWNSVKTDFRTDFRALKNSETWDASITTNLPDGTPLILSIDHEQTKLPAGYVVTVEDMATGIVQDLEQGAYVVPVKAGGIPRQIRINLERDEEKDRHKRHEKKDHR